MPAVRLWRRGRQELLRLGADLAYGDRHRGVTVVALDDGAAVEGEDVALA